MPEFQHERDNHGILGRSLALTSIRSTSFEIVLLWDSDNIAQLCNMSNTAKDPAESITNGEGAGTTPTETVEIPCLPPHTDLRVDWGDACNLVYLADLNQ